MWIRSSCGKELARGSELSLSALEQVTRCRYCGGRRVHRLVLAQKTLQERHPTLKLSIFDAYRPLEVQQYMVDYTFRDLSGGVDAEQARRHVKAMLRTSTELLWTLVLTAARRRPAREDIAAGASVLG
eukprot:scaffold912_cov422-Prasinococcus_capsulatus_cf.AAC.16